MIQSNRSNTQENMAEERGVKNEGLEEGEEGAEEDATGSTSEE